MILDEVPEAATSTRCTLSDPAKVLGSARVSMARGLSDSDCKDLGIRGEAEGRGTVAIFKGRTFANILGGGACSPCDAGRLAYNISGSQRLYAPQHGKEVGGSPRKPLFRVGYSLSHLFVASPRSETPVNPLLHNARGRGSRLSQILGSRAVLPR